jgi:predicted PurR-regulated permease PerM
VAATLVIIFGVLLVSTTLYVFYNKAAAFMETLPEYTGKIQHAVEPLTKKIQKIQENAGKLNPAPAPKKVPEVRVNEGPTWPSYLARGVGSVGSAILVAGVIPFLMFFMLLRKDHIYEWLCTTFATVTDVPAFVTRVTRMVRGFSGGNLIIGSVMAIVIMGVLFGLRLEGAFALGMVSGFLNLIPFLGVVLAGVVPLLAATIQFGSAGPFLIIAATIITLHLVSANLLIPKFIGSRVNIGPVAATVGMLFWSWLWGGIGLLLAVPLTAFVKLVADCDPALLPISNLLAERPRSVPRWAQASGATVSRALPFLRTRFRVGQKQ